MALLLVATQQQDPEARLTLTRGITISMAGFVGLVASALPLAAPVLGPEPGWVARVIFFALTALAASVGCMLGEIIWLVVASRFVSRERLQRCVLSRPQRQWLRKYRRWMLDSISKG